MYAYYTSGEHPPQTTAVAIVAHLILKEVHFPSLSTNYMPEGTPLEYLGTVYGVEWVATHNISSGWLVLYKVTTALFKLRTF